MNRREKTPTWPWAATLDLPDGWVEVPAGHQRQPLLPSRGPYFRAAKQLVDMGSISADMVKRTQLYFSQTFSTGQMGLAPVGVCCHLFAPSSAGLASGGGRSGRGPEGDHVHHHERQVPSPRTVPAWAVVSNRRASLARW